MAQHDYVIANGTGAAVRSDLNNALAAIVSQNSGATAPATTYAYQWWADTTTGLLKLRNAANSGWITLFQLDGEWSTIALENGTAGAPSIYFKDSGTDTGIYSPGTDQVAISTGGTGRLFIDSSGRLLIGTSTARSTSTVNWTNQIESGNGLAGLGVTSNINDTAGAYLSLAKSRGTTVGSNTIVQNNDGLGYILFSGADGTDVDTQAALIGCEVDGTPGVNDMPGRLVFSTTADGGSSPTERMRITNGGGLLINTTTHRDSARLVVDGDGTNANSVWYAPTTTAYSVLKFRNPNGEVGRIDLSGTSTSYVTTSDYRVKENVSPLTGAIDRLNQLQVHRFNFKADPVTTVDGFIAHEAQAVVPECVTGTKDEVDADGNPVYQGIDQSKMVPLAIAAIQECVKRIEMLEAELALLKARP